MTVLFAGNEQDAFTSGSVTTWVTSTTRRRTAYTRMAMGLHSTDELRAPFAPVDELYYQSQYHWNWNPTGQQWVRFGSVANGTWHYVANNSSSFDLYVWNGSSWDLIVSMTPRQSMNNGNLHAYTMQLRLHVTDGLIRIWRDGVLLCEATGLDTRQSAPYDQFSLFGQRGTRSITSSASIDCVSEVLISTRFPYGMGVYTRQPTGDGAATDWIGGHADLSSASSHASASIRAAAADLDYLFTHAAAIPTGLNVRGVVLGTRGLFDGTGPTGVKPLQRHADTTHAGATLVLDATEKGYPIVLDSALGGGAWTPDLVNDSQFGWRSAA